MKYLAQRRYELFLLTIILLATVARGLLIGQNWPVTNSDEANMALLARHVAYNGEWPIFFYGLPYMGPIEGYLAAPLFHIFGSSTFLLRVSLLPFFCLFLLSLYYLTRLLYTPELAFFTVLLLCFGSSEVIQRQVKAVGEYPEIVFFAASICLLVIRLAYSAPSIDQPSKPGVRRVLTYGGLGILVGLALWDDFLILPFIGTGALLLFFFCRHELQSRAGISLLLGVILGAFPLIIYNLTAPLTQNSFSVLLSIHSSGSSQHLPFLQQTVGTLFIGLPNATGYNPLCSDSSFPYFHPATVPVSIPCMVFQGGWSLGYLILWIVATVLVVRFLWRYGRTTSWLRPKWDDETRRRVVLECGRLMLLLSAIGTLILYALSPNAAAAPSPTARYLVCLQIAFPCVMWPLWQGLARIHKDERWSARIASLARGCLLLLILAIYVAGSIETIADIPNARAAYTQQNELVQKLLTLDATRIYSEYWTCNRLTFQSQEKIICSALDEQLQPGFDRYAPYHTLVKSSAHPAYVFPAGMPQVAALDEQMKQNKNASAYQRLTFHGYILYIPIRS